MTDPVLPTWEGDPLSTFLSDAQRNERVSALKMPDLYAVLQRVHATLGPPPNLQATMKPL